MKTTWCQICDCDDEEVLETHHIDGNRNNNAQENLMTLCCNCHMKIHHRNFYLNKKIPTKREIFNDERLKEILNENRQRDIVKDAWIYLYLKKAKKDN